MRARVLVLLGLWVLGLVYPMPGQPATPVESGADIEVLVREGCPSCAAAKRFLESLQRERPALHIIFYDVGGDPAALARLLELAEQNRVQA